MKLLGITCLIALLTGFGVSSSAAAAKPAVVPTKAHAKLTIGEKRIIVSSEKTQLVFKPTYFCSTLQGVSYGAALVGLQSVLIVLPSFASGVGAPVAPIATGIGTFSSGVGFVTMVAHDVVCK